MMNFLHYNSSQRQRTFSIGTVDVDIHFIVDGDLDGKIKRSTALFMKSDEISEQNREDNHIILMLLIQSLLILS